jgi:hypothetical protein
MQSSIKFRTLELISRIVFVALIFLIGWKPWMMYDDNKILYLPLIVSLCILVMLSNNYFFNKITPTKYGKRPIINYTTVTFLILAIVMIIFVLRTSDNLNAMVYYGSIAALLVIVIFSSRYRYEIIISDKYIIQGGYKYIKLNHINAIDKANKKVVISTKWKKMVINLEEFKSQDHELMKALDELNVK